MSEFTPDDAGIVDDWAGRIGLVTTTRSTREYHHKENRRVVKPSVKPLEPSDLPREPLRSANELNTVKERAFALETSGDVEGALELVKRALDSRTGPYDELLQLQSNLQCRLQAVHQLDERVVARAIHMPIDSQSNVVDGDRDVTPVTFKMPALTFTSDNAAGTLAAVKRNLQSKQSVMSQDLTTPWISRSNDGHGDSDMQSPEEHSGIGVRLPARLNAKTPFLELLPGEGAHITSRLNRAANEEINTFGCTPEAQTRSCDFSGDQQEPHTGNVVTGILQTSQAKTKKLTGMQSVRFCPGVQSVQPVDEQANSTPCHVEGQPNLFNKTGNTIDAGHTPFHSQKPVVHFAAETTSTVHAYRDVKCPAGAEAGPGKAETGRLVLNAGSTPAVMTSGVSESSRDLGPSVNLGSDMTSLSGPLESEDTMPSELTPFVCFDNPLHSTSGSLDGTGTMSSCQESDPKGFRRPSMKTCLANQPSTGARPPIAGFLFPTPMPENQATAPPLLDTPGCADPKLSSPGPIETQCLSSPGLTSPECGSLSYTTPSTAAGVVKTPFGRREGTPAFGAVDGIDSGYTAASTNPSQLISTPTSTGDCGESTNELLDSCLTSQQGEGSPTPATPATHSPPLVDLSGHPTVAEPYIDKNTVGNARPPADSSEGDNMVCEWIQNSAKASRGRAGHDGFGSPVSGDWGGFAVVKASSDASTPSIAAPSTTASPLPLTQASTSGRRDLNSTPYSPRVVTPCTDILSELDDEWTDENNSELAGSPVLGSSSRMERKESDEDTSDRVEALKLPEMSSPSAGDGSFPKTSEQDGEDNESRFETMSTLPGIVTPCRVDGSGECVENGECFTEETPTASRSRKSVCQRELKSLLSDPFAQEAIVEVEKQKANASVFAAVRADQHQVQTHMSPVVLTPVRRSGRVSVPSSTLHEQLDQCGWTYTPNKSLPTNQMPDSEDLVNRLSDMNVEETQ